MSVRISGGGAVDCRSWIDLPLKAVSVWGQIRDFQRFARHDLFHSSIEIEGAVPRAGASLKLSHRYAGIEVERIGRILIWREERGYAFSDLSKRGSQAAFPHVFSYVVHKRGDRSCRLEIRVRGKWTSMHVPHWAARIWLAWAFGEVVRKVRNDFLAYEIWRQRREIGDATSSGIE